MTKEQVRGIGCLIPICLFLISMAIWGWEIGLILAVIVFIGLFFYSWFKWGWDLAKLAQLKLDEAKYKEKERKAREAEAKKGGEF